MSEPSEPYLGILISSDGTVCRIGFDGFPIESAPEPFESDRPSVSERLVLDVDPAGVIDIEGSSASD